MKEQTEFQEKSQSPIHWKEAQEQDYDERHEGVNERYSRELMEDNHYNPNPLD